MAKVALKFKRGWSRYNKDEIAVFDEGQAGDLIKAGLAVKSTKQPPKADLTLSIDIPDVRKSESFKKAVAELKEEDARLRKLAGELDDRAEALDEREAELVARESEAAGSASGAAGATEPQAGKNPEASKSTNDAAKGNLPKQGTKG